MLDKRISEVYISTRGATCAHKKPARCKPSGFFFVSTSTKNPIISQRITSPALAQDAVT